MCKNRIADNGGPCQNRWCNLNFLDVQLVNPKPTPRAIALSQKYGNCVNNLDGYTLNKEEIAELWGVSRQRVDQIEKRALGNRIWQSAKRRLLGMEVREYAMEILGVREEQAKTQDTL
uniref:Putative sigma-70 region domain containing protein n=1 Tax=viral metagenome TaxID=1070528 RepID=A0A6M3K1V9_9ZZZZ